MQYKFGEKVRIKDIPFYKGSYGIVISVFILQDKAYYNIKLKYDVVLKRISEEYLTSIKSRSMIVKK